MLAAVGLNAGQAASPQTAGSPQLTVMGVACSRIKELGIDKQDNMRATAIRVGCGLEAPGDPDEKGEPVDNIFSPMSAPVNVNTITGGEVYPKVTESESMVWSDGTAIVVNYNDSRDAPNNYSGVSRSTDGGATFTRLLPSPFATGHGTNFGDPIVVFNVKLNKWFAGDLATGCGGQGIGLWTSVDHGATWQVGACAHSGGNDDRESMWVDNNAASPFFGRMYISWNDFNLGGGALRVTRSDDGVTWTAVTVNAGFIRDVQITGGPDGAVFLATMNEGSGGLSSRTNVMYRSTDGGLNWTQLSMGGSFAAAGDGTCASNSYFAMIAPIWRHMGWGQPGVGPNSVVHYAYASRGVNAGDTGDIRYVRSLDNGSTWSAPIVLNTDQAAGGTRTQWMPSLSVTSDGKVQVYWYDRRNTTTGTNYQVFGRQSADNGATWQADAAVSDVIIPQPLQPDPNVQACYAGDYNYASASGGTHFATWTDGRVPVSGNQQQDVFFAAVPAAGGNPTPDFSLGNNPSSLTIQQGNSGNSTTTVTSTNGYNSAVNLSCSGQPAGITCGFATNPVTPPANGSANSALTVSVDAGVAAATYNFNVSGTDGATTHTAPISVQVTGVTPGDFSVNCSPSSFNIKNGNFTRTSTCTVQSLNGFNQSVSFSCSNQPAGLSCSYQPAAVTPPPNGTASATLTLTASGVAKGSYQFQAVGTGGGNTHSANLSLRVR